MNSVHEQLLKQYTEPKNWLGAPSAQPWPACAPRCAQVVRAHRALGRVLVVPPGRVANWPGRVVCPGGRVVACTCSPLRRVTTQPSSLMPLLVMIHLVYCDTKPQFLKSPQSRYTLVYCDTNSSATQAASVTIQNLYRDTAFPQAKPLLLSRYN